MAESLYRRIFWPVLAPSILFGIAGGATVPVQILAAMSLGAPASLAALIVAIAGGISLSTMVHAGRLIDRLGDRRAMLLATGVAAGLTGTAIAALVWAGPGALFLFVGATLMQAPAMNVWSLARQAYTAEHVGLHQVGRAMTALGGTMRIGNLVGPLLGGVLLLWLPIWSVYVLSVVCSVLAVAILYSGMGGRLDSAGPKVPLRKVPQGRPKLDVDWMRVALAGAAIMALMVARVSQPVIVQLWGVHLGLSESVISLLIATGATVEIMLMFPGGYLKDRLGRTVILVTCLVVYGSGFLLIVPASQAWGLPGMVLAVVVMAIGNGLGAGVNMTIGADLSPSEGRARFLGIWALFSGAGQFAGPLMISALVAGPGVAASVFTVGGIALVGACWMLAFHGRIGLPRGTRRA